MSNIQKRGGYTPRRVREQRAYRLVMAGSVSGVLGVVLAVLAVAGASTGFPALLLIIVAVVCGVVFRSTTS